MFIRYYTRHPRKKEELGKSNQIFAKIVALRKLINQHISYELCGEIADYYCKKKLNMETR